MSKTVLYVHGTGVRKSSYESSAARIAAGLQRAVPGVRLEPCLWGDAYGATLKLDGVSIPEYVKPAAVVGAEEVGVALWDLLARDELFELREMGAFTAGVIESPLLRENKQALKQAFAQLPADAQVLAVLGNYAAASAWPAVVDHVAASPVTRTAIDAARIALGPLRLAIGRAIVATLQARLAALNSPPLPAAERDDLVERCAEVLGGREGGGIMDWLTSRLVGFGLSWATAKARRKREALYGVAAPTAGDVVMYQARGQQIRDFIEERIRQCGDDVTIIAHSLGGIACVDLLIKKKLPQVQTLITVGSQAPFLYEINALSSLEFGKPLPEHFPKRWLNFFDYNDLLSYKAEPVFTEHAKDVEVSSGQPFPASHSAYWNEQVFWDKVRSVLVQVAA
jgi:hypothetical protein